METRRARSFELATPTACDAVLARDRGILQADDRFLSANQFTYYVGINAWLIQISHWCGPIYQTVFDVMVRDGLRSTVLRFCEQAEHLVAGREVDDPLVEDVLDSLVLYPRDFRYLPKGAFCDPLAVKLQLCRFLKRMNLLEASALDVAMKRDFCQTQVDLLLMVRDSAYWSRNHQLLARAADRLAHHLDFEEIRRLFDQMGPHSRVFTSGAARETGRSFSAKLKTMAAQNPSYFRPIFGDYLGGLPPRQFTDELWESDIAMGLPKQTWPYHPVRVTTAPKAMKGPRIIAVEPLQYQTATKWLQQRLYGILPGSLNLRDQSVNQDLARSGSAGVGWATIDLSAASDYVTKALVWALFPEDIAKDFLRYAPTHFSIDKGTNIPLVSFATMGNGLTFWVESVVFWAICAAVVDDAYVNDVIVYGDDIVVPEAFYDDVTGALTSLGFRVNMAKSYGSGPYRESCGLEAWGGNELYSCYYPRMPLSGEITEHTCAVSNLTYFDAYSDEYYDCTSRLVSLQHRLYRVCLPAARFVAAVVQDAHPLMTAVRWGDEFAPDLWAADTQLPAIPDLYGSIVKVGWRGPRPNSIVSEPYHALRYSGWGAEVAVKAPIVESEHTRSVRYFAKTSYVGSVDEDAVPLYELFRYWEFLEKGPQPLYPDDTVPVPNQNTVPALTAGAALRRPVLRYGLFPF